MACRLPGGIDGPDAFWDLLARGGDAMREGFPARWDGLDLYDPTGQAAGKTCSNVGGFIDDMEHFDAGFFGIAPRDAQIIDPQQRLVLETAWQALERAGLTQAALSESATGVYLGNCGCEYSMVAAQTLEDLDGATGTSNAPSLIAGRLSYVLGLQGPALTVDTACSSSLVALHLACTALRQKECDLALAGGVTLFILPAMLVEFGRIGATSPQGRCKSFSADANGAGWGEGCGILVLKRLSDAQRDGDRVLAVVRGTAVNQDGRSQGLTAPNGPSQQRVIRDALAASRLSPHEIDAIEAHGTGTALGDPIEAGALAAVFASGRDAARPVYLGSSKSNVGHTVAAAGVTGVMKMVLALQHEQLPKTLHADVLSPHIPWQDSGLCVLQEARAWPRSQRVRRAGVSSFGVSGTNAHVVLEEAPAVAHQPHAEPATDGVLPFLISARDERALGAQASQLARWLEQHPGARLADVAHTAALRRSQFEERAVVLADSAGVLREGLHALAAGNAHPALTRGKAKPGGKVVFVYPGFGSQWPAMARALLAESALFAERVRACDAALTPWSGWSVLALLRGDDTASLPSWERNDVVQQAIFTMAVALSALWRERGLEPAAVVGHSQGEIPAAVVAGALTLEEGAQIVAVRSQMLYELAGSGANLMVAEPHDKVAARIVSYGPALSIAAVNGPSSTLVSGLIDAVERLAASLQAEGVFCRRVRGADVAAHSAQVDCLIPRLACELAALRPQASKVPFYSTVAGARLGGERLDAEYWCRNMRETVRLDRALAQLIEDGHGVFVEVSPHPLLGLPLSSASERSGGVVIGSLQRDHGGLSQLYRGLSELHVQGQAVDWQRVLRDSGGRAIDLPTYAFQRDRYWVDKSKVRADARSMGLTAVEHPLLGAMTPLADSDGYLFASRLSLREHAWLSDHAAQGTVLLPGTGMLELALHAGRAVGLSALRELTSEQPLILPADADVQIQLSVGAPDERGERKVAIYSRSGEGAWTENAIGALSASAGEAPEAEFEELRSWPVEGSDALDLDDFYPRLAAIGVHYGPTFQGLVELRRAGQVAYGRAILPKPIKASAGQYGLHPALFDAALHTLLALTAGERREIWLPFSWSDVQLYASGASELRVRVERIAQDAEGQAAVSVTIADALGDPVASVGRLCLRRARLEELEAASQKRVEHLYRLAFQPLTLADEDAAGLAVLGGAGALAVSLGAACYPDLEALWAACAERAPQRLIVDATSAPAQRELAAAAGEQTARELSLLQQLLADERLAQCELVWVTASAVGSGDWPVTDLAHAPLWGLVRSARSEHPERTLRLLDVGPAQDWQPALIARALAASHELELALRGGQALGARLCDARAPAGDDALPRASLGPTGTALITGGTGELGAAVARHLVAAHGVRHLILTSRRGLTAPGAAELVEQLAALGAESVQVLACDVAVRADVERALARVPADHPLTSVFHLAATLDDGTIERQNAERLASVFAPKVDGALHLHELTRGADLAAFVLFSSASGTLGGAGQANYAAANTFLDALAAQRRHQGLPAVSLAWGLWQPAGQSATSRLQQADLARMARQGALPMTVDECLRALDASLARPEPHLIPIRLDLAQLQRAFAELPEVPSLLRGLVRPGLRRAAASRRQALELRERLASLPESERAGALVELVRSQVASVLGMSGPSAIDPDRELQKLGLDSLTAVELRNRLSALAGTTLPATVAFDYPTPRGIARWLGEQAFGKLEAAAQPARRPRRAAPDEPIAIVSMACRLPGGIASPEDYWQLLAQGRDAIEPFPGRWDGLDLHDPDSLAPGKSRAREGGFVHGSDLFDAPFFGIRPEEARAMDPQQRFVLETAWEALERGGIPPTALSETATGVYIGAAGDGYESLSLRHFEDADGFHGIGNTLSVIAGRLSYVLGLQGPSLTVDTACSSSLVALHLACNGLRNRECDLALTGGVTMIPSPFAFVESTRLGLLAADGRCKSFSARADGAGWAEGCGILVLKRLADARRDGDRVLAVVRGSAVNQDGRSQGLAAPNGPAQQRVIRDALTASRLAPDDIDAVEAHGTGTALGDPIEAGALSAVFAPERDPERPLYLGSAKSNLGHTMAAAGVVGVIKLVLSLQHELLPQTLHAAQLSPNIDWSDSGLAVLQAARAWPRGKRMRRAGVSSFGISGTNAHAILEEAPSAVAEPGEPAPALPVYPLLISGRDGAALRAQAERLARWLREHAETPLADVARSAALHRSQFEQRAVVLASSHAEALDGLDAIAARAPHPAVVRANDETRGKLALLFSGQGSQRPGMGAALYGALPAFRRALDEVASALQAELGRSLLELMFAPAGSAEAELLNETQFTQPALFALEVALFRQWQAWGVKPDVLLGHSIGELSAAHVAGVLSLGDAAKLVAARGRLMQGCRRGGAMVSLEAAEHEVRAALERFGAGIEIAGVNGPEQTVVSGDATAVMAFAERFECRGRRSRRLQVSHAFHSAHMDAMLSAFAEVAAGCTYHPPQLSLVSLRTGQRMQAGDFTTADYWVRQLREAVRFGDGMHTLETEGVRCYLECGPDGVLAAMGARCVSDGARLFPSLRAGHDEAHTLIAALGALHVCGQTIDWQAVFGSPRRPPVPLPTYAFQHQSYWPDMSVLSSMGGARLESGERALWSALRAGDGQRAAELLELSSEEGEALGPLLQRIATWTERHGRAAAPGAEQKENELREARERLLAAAAEERPALILDTLLASLRQASRCEAPDAATELSAIGLDSLAAIELVRQLRAVLGVPLSPRDVIGSTTLGALSQALAARMAQAAEPRELGEPAAVTTLRPAPSARSERTLSARGRQHCVSTWGDPTHPPVLCVHGYRDQGPVWEDLALELVAQRKFVIAPDLRGHGLSADEARGGAALVDFVGDLLALCEQLPVTDAVLVGHSLGAVVAAGCAAREPGRFTRLCLLEPILVSPFARDSTLRVRAAERSYASEDEAMEVFARFHPAMRRSLRQALVRRSLKRVPEGLAWRGDPNPISLGGWPSEEEYLALLRQVELPSTVVFGEGSELVSAQQARLIAQALRTTRLVGVPGGHWIHYEQAARVAALIAELSVEHDAAACAG